ncbi:MAG TPA: hypothetical protein VKA27_03130 [Sunxiuqinia sp.]|nr:hypothetical protein [Sunxiuqinia sp.]
MKKVGLLFSLLMLFALYTQAQNINEVNGVYYAESIPYTGTYTKYFDNGNTEMQMKLDKGIKNGEVKIYFENGKLKEIRHYKNNEMDGTWITYNQKAQKVALANYNEGVKNGKWMIWDDNGSLIYEMNYKDGQKVCTWKKYDAKGQVVSERIF